MKPDTSKGFHPHLAAGPDILSPARNALRLDGVLEGSILSPRIQRFLLDWARLRNVHSSAKLEGNPLNVHQAQEVLRRGQGASSDEEEILRLTRAYGRIHDTGRFPQLTIDEILDLHRDLFEGVLPPEDRPGQLKNRANGVYDEATGNFVFEATLPERTEAELNALLQWFYGPAQLMDPAVACGMFFVEFQAIHPFMDGNGRVGRLLNMRLLRSTGFKNATLTAFDGHIFRRREQYYKTLRATNLGHNYHVWLRFYSDTLRRAYREAVARGDLRPVLDKITAQSERNILEWALTTGIDWFQRGDFPNPQEYADVTLSTALSNLHGAGFLDREGERRTARYRVSEPFLQRIYDRELELDQEDSLT